MSLLSHTPGFCRARVNALREVAIEAEALLIEGNPRRQTGHGQLLRLGLNDPGRGSRGGGLGRSRYCQWVRSGQVHTAVVQQLAVPVDLAANPVLDFEHVSFVITLSEGKEEIVRKQGAKHSFGDLPPWGLSPSCTQGG